MACFAVSYQLNDAKNYQTLWDELKRLGGHKVMRSFYFLDVDVDTARELLGHLKAYVDNDDMLSVVKMTSRPACQMCFKGTKAWLDERF